MPSLTINCSISLDGEQKKKLLKSLSALVARLTGKPESFVLTSYTESEMTFGGTDEPAAFVYLTSLGALGPNNNDLVKGITGLLEEATGVPPKRVYVQLVDAEVAVSFCSRIIGWKLSRSEGQMPLLFLERGGWFNDIGTLLALVISILLPLLTIPSIFCYGRCEYTDYFTNKHVLVTGGSSGIGKETARKLASYGARVTIVGRSQTRLSSSVIEIQAKQTGAHEVVGLQYDVSTAEASESMVEEAERRQGPVDVLVNSVGCGMASYFEETKPAVFEDMMRGNYFAALYPTLAVFKRMKERKRGHIALTSSLAGLLGVFGFSAYSPTKYAIRGLAEVLWYEGKPFGVNVSVLYPPDTDTPGFKTEQVGKPEETVKISESGGLWDPSVVANRLLRALARRQFRVTVGFDGNALAMVTAGMSPETSLFEILAMPILRLASLFYVWRYKRIIAKGHKKRSQKQTKAKSA